MLVNCVAYEHGHRARDLQLSEVRDWLEHNSGFVWVALRDPDEDEIARAKAAFQLPDDASATFDDPRRGRAAGERPCRHG